MMRMSVATISMFVSIWLNPAAYCGTEFQPVNMNAASTEQIMVLPGVGKKLAERIVAHRKDNGPFASLEDLLLVKGMHKKVLEEIAGRTEFTRSIIRKSSQEKTRATEAPGQKLDNSRIEQQIARFEKEPKMKEVQDRALKYALSDPGRAQSWENRARIAPSLPNLSFSGGRGVDHDSTLREKVGDESSLSKKSSSDLNLGVKLEWKFSELVFNQNELRVARESFRMAVIRERIISDLTKAYIERKRAKIKLATIDPSDLTTRLDQELRVEELEAVLDGLTGGWFSEATAIQ